MSSTPVEVDAAVVLLGASVTAITHPLLYVKLLIQVGHEPLPPAAGTTMFGRPVLYLPGFFSYGELWLHIWDIQRPKHSFVGATVVGSISASSCHMCKAPNLGWIYSDFLLRFSQIILGYILQRHLNEDIIPFIPAVKSLNANPDVIKWFHFGLFSCIMKIFKEEGLSGFYIGFVPHVLGEVLFLWCCNLLAYFINTYAVDDITLTSTAFLQITLSVLTYPFTLVADVMAVNNCGLAAGLPPRFPVFKSWLHCWNHLSTEVCRHPDHTSIFLFIHTLSLYQTYIIVKKKKRKKKITTL
uniref:Mitochondrial carrier 1 n=1 Tax=Poecilia latipinna TaxID=48699 RepID=A0A3B3V8E6_9TELE